MCPGGILADSVSKPANKIWQTSLETSKLEDGLIRCYRAAVLCTLGGKNTHRDSYQRYGFVRLCIPVAPPPSRHRSLAPSNLTPSSRTSASWRQLWTSNPSHATNIRSSDPASTPTNATFGDSYTFRSPCPSRSLCGHVTSVFQAS